MIHGFLQRLGNRSLLKMELVVIPMFFHFPIQTNPSMISPQSLLWNRASSTHALGNILKSIGCMGSLVLLLYGFVDYFTNLNLDESLMAKRHANSYHGETQNHHDNGGRQEEHPLYCLVNQAFSVAVGKVLEGYVCALDTIYASVILRHPAKEVDLTLHTSASGCLKSVLHSEITLLELHLHTKELRTQIEY
ncbi:Gamma-tubulin complex component [Quillaja saponaria]|uniref:Gamma-tubulin complex component n=1 Tax=Quillaja saponaria TaxID=32244 RepID=A0AAD7LLL8_QUISA|nr:Gamma-tubulin complex component [Quillaja saponaria]